MLLKLYPNEPNGPNGPSDFTQRAVPGRAEQVGPCAPLVLMTILNVTFEIVNTLKAFNARLIAHEGRVQK